jgi:hypothetical protein
MTTDERTALVEVCCIIQGISAKILLSRNDLYNVVQVLALYQGKDSIRQAKDVLSKQPSKRQQFPCLCHVCDRVISSFSTY